MTQFEKAEISRLPKKYKPMGAWGYFWHNFLYCIPVLGLIILIANACSDKNLSRRGYARSILLTALISIILAVVAVGAFFALLLGGFFPQEVVDMLAGYGFAV